MTLLSTMKDRIAREVRRPSGISTQIEEAIMTAIEQYQGRNFWFNRSRETTFTTVADQEFYTETNIGATIWKIDYVTLYVGDLPYLLDVEKDPERLERLSASGTQTGQPRWFSWYGNRMRLYPTPDTAYTVRIAGVISAAAPASDEEPGNVWMNEGEYLIRQRAKYELAVNVLHDADIEQASANLVAMELERLTERTAQKQQSGGWTVTPTQF